MARSILAALLGAVLLLPSLIAPGLADPAQWRSEWPETDFSRRSVPFHEILAGGPPRDGIPAVDDPSFVPVAVTFCPLCNTGIVFDRRLDGGVLAFGTTGKLRNSDLVMYDRTTESWWQQFSGEAIVGELTGARLEMIPARLESFARFKERAPDGQVQVPRSPAPSYGHNPYVDYDSLAQPFLYIGPLPLDIAPLARVVRVGDQAWSLALLRERGEIRADDLPLTWQPGQASALDTEVIADGADVGNMVVERRTADGWQDAVYSVDFAFAFHAFHPDGRLHTK